MGLLILTDQSESPDGVVRILGSRQPFSDARVVNCCADAVSQLSQTTFGCVVIEVDLKSQLDFELLRMMRTGELTLDEETPVVVVTDHQAITTALEKSELACFVSSTFQKPFQVEDLMAAIQT